jgi:TRAP-type mannitol/chloroaromatic compound transport system substrate-binding protein
MTSDTVRASPLSLRLAAALLPAQAPEEAMPENKTIARRKLLALGAAGSAALVAAPSIVRAQSTITWRMATSWPKNAPGVGVNAQRCADSIAAMSGGRLKIQFFAAGELVPPFEVFEAVSAGTVQAGHGTPYYWQGKDRVFHFFTGVPFGLTAQEHAAWIAFGGGQALWEKAYAPFGVLPFYAGSSGAQATGWFRKEISSLDDIKGLKMRIAGLGAEIMRRLGASVVLTPPGEIFAAMQSGAVDAAEWIGPWNDLAFGLYRVAKFYYLRPFHELGPALEFIVNKGAYDALPADLKEVVKRAAMASAYESLADFTFHNIVSLEPLLAKEGVQLKTMPDDVLRAMGQQSETILAEIGGATPLAKEIYESFTGFRKKAIAYGRESEGVIHSVRIAAIGG